MRHVMSEGKAACSLTFNMSCTLLPLYEYSNPHIPQDNQGFLLYEVFANQKSSIGLVCLISLAKNRFPGVFCHEKTYMQHAQKIYLELVDSTIQHNPILFITDNSSFSTLLTNLQSKASHLKEVSLESQGIHRLWKVNNYSSEIIIPEGICLADGHHRYRAIQKLAHELGDKKEVFFLAAVFPSHAVTTRRKGLLFSALSVDPVLISKRLSSIGELKVVKTTNQKDCLYFFIGNDWYQFKFDRKLRGKFSADILDVELLNHLIFKDIPHLNNAIKKQNFSLFPEKGLLLELELPKAARWGFILPADPVLNVIALAKKGHILEPNSTFFDPKFINGLITHKIVKDS